MFWFKQEQLKQLNPPMPLFTTGDSEKMQQVKICIELADAAAYDLGFPENHSIRRNLNYAIKIIEGSVRLQHKPTGEL